MRTRVDREMPLRADGGRSGRRQSPRPAALHLQARDLQFAGKGSGARRASRSESGALAFRRDSQDREAANTIPLCGNQLRVRAKR
jgi:hypothetical protein